MRHAVPWIGILFLTGAFHFFRGAPVDGVIFLLAGLALTTDALGLLGRPLTSWRLSARVAVPLGLLAGVILAAAPRYGVADTVTVSLLGLILLPAVWPQPDASPADDEQRETAGIRRAGILWSCVGVVGCLWEVLAYFLGLPSVAAEYTHPPLSDLIGPLLDTMPGRAICVALWLLGGYALLRRGRRQ